MMTEVVAFSGGVDSTALALLMPGATPVFTDTGAEFPHVYEHIEKFERVTGREVVRLVSRHGSLYDIIRDQKYLPNHGARFCTRQVKIEPMNKYLEAQRPARLNIALRADEEGRTGNTTEMDGLEIAYPLRVWGMVRSDVVRVCLEHDLLPRYPVYAARGGCMNCFYKRKSEVLAMTVLVPNIMDELQELEESVQDERGKFFHMFPSIGMSIAELRMQPPLFDMTAVYADAANRSDYGQACGLFCNR